MKAPPNSLSSHSGSSHSIPSSNGCNVTGQVHGVTLTA